MTIEIHSVSLEDLSEFAKTLAKKLLPTDCVCLTGPMGAGKTTLGYFLVQAWLAEDVLGYASPTFTIMNQYASTNGRCVNHVDLYRLESFAAFEDLDLMSEWQKPNTLTLVEWGEKFLEICDLFTHRIEIRLDSQDSQKRSIEISSQ